MRGPTVKACLRGFPEEVISRSLPNRQSWGGNGVSRASSLISRSRSCWLRAGQAFVAGVEGSRPALTCGLLLFSRDQAETGITEGTRPAMNHFRRSWRETNGRDRK